MSVETIVLRTMFGAIEVPASPSDRRGEWATHRLPGGGWRVTHTPSGRSLATLADDLTHRDARRIVSMIDSEIPELRAQERDGGQQIEVDPEHRFIIEAIVAKVVGS